MRPELATQHNLDTTVPKQEFITASDFINPPEILRLRYVSLHQIPNPGFPRLLEVSLFSHQKLAFLPACAPLVEHAADGSLIIRNWRELVEQGSVQIDTSNKCANAIFFAYSHPELTQTKHSVRLAFPKAYNWEIQRVVTPYGQANLLIDKVNDKWTVVPVVHRQQITKESDSLVLAAPIGTNLRPSLKLVLAALQNSNFPIDLESPSYLDLGGEGEIEPVES